mmetsp:Transcript_66681/g.206209  ORF Transcript_66681/g.206209 Transcript_66681/m.206209 type:complete len:309 (+) Transcript_66681:435-1361(+)
MFLWWCSWAAEEKEEEAEGAVKEGIGALHSGIGGLSWQVFAQEERFSSLSQRLRRLDGKLDHAVKDLTQKLDVQLTGTAWQPQGMEKRLSGLEYQVSELQKSVVQLSDQLRPVCEVLGAQKLPPSCRLPPIVASDFPWGVGSAADGVGLDLGAGAGVHTASAAKDAPEYRVSPVAGGAGVHTVKRARELKVSWGDGGSAGGTLASPTLSRSNSPSSGGAAKSRLPPMVANGLPQGGGGGAADASGLGLGTGSGICAQAGGPEFKAGALDPPAAGYAAVGDSPNAVGVSGSRSTSELEETPRLPPNWGA